MSKALRNMIGFFVILFIAVISTYYRVTYVAMLFYGVLVLYIVYMFVMMAIDAINNTSGVTGNARTYVIPTGWHRPKWVWRFGYPIILWNNRIFEQDWEFLPRMWYDVNEHGDHIQKLWGFTLGLAHPHKRSYRIGFVPAEKYKKEGFGDSSYPAYYIIPYCHNIDEFTRPILYKSTYDLNPSYSHSVKFNTKVIIKRKSKEIELWVMNQLHSIEKFDKIPLIGWRLNTYIEFEEGVGAPHEMIYDKHN